MKYKDLNYRNNNKNKTNFKKKLLTLTGIGLMSVVALLLGFKFLISPVIGSVSGFFTESSKTLSFLSNQNNLKKDDGVTNILLIGVDERVKGDNTLTDTIIIGSYRHVDDKITLLSLPRDLWVSVPAFNDVSRHSTKINSVYSLGEEYDYPGGGIALLDQVIYEHFDLPLHYHAQINFNGFVAAIDAIGGVDVFVERNFTDYMYPRTGYENAAWEQRWQIVSFEQGWQHMDGETALHYARSRHAIGPEGSDFARAKRQQKIILALKEKLLSSETLLSISKLRDLYSALIDEVQTDIGLGDLPAFYALVDGIDDFSNIDTHVLSNDTSNEDGLLYVPDAGNFGGAFVLLPREGWVALQEHIHEIIYQTKTEEEPSTPTNSPTLYE